MRSRKKSKSAHANTHLSSKSEIWKGNLALVVHNVCIWPIVQRPRSGRFRIRRAGRGHCSACTTRAGTRHTCGPLFIVAGLRGPPTNAELRRSIIPIIRILGCKYRRTFNPIHVFGQKEARRLSACLPHCHPTTASHNCEDRHTNE